MKRLTASGSAAAATARLVIVAALCAFQYWLLATTIESHHAGNHRISLFTFIVSMICFVSGAALVVTGETGELATRKIASKKEGNQDDG
ncbi:MAG: hypothetical protein A2X94_10360 [Bdellovibrionales bacterium GWB1_55_8]|nr:MAG: hypothetical protein A2X94_10360 [Bdellovibrionales bacterium GWB1_55_8]